MSSVARKTDEWGYMGGEAAPALMAILNVNPDSFCDGGKYEDCSAAVAQAKQMVAEGASIIDVGGESTRPGAEAIDVETEWRRVGPVLAELRAWLREENARREWLGVPAILLSVDTYKAEVARRSLELDVDIVNDISGSCSEPEILDVLADSNAGYILVHNAFVCRPPEQGAERGILPHARKEHVAYAEPLSAISAELRRLYDRARAVGCRNIILDPGLGFGKDVSCNWQILANLSEFSQQFCQAGREELSACPPLLIGASNKRFVRCRQEQEETLGLNNGLNSGSFPLATGYDEETQGHDPYRRFLSANLAVCASAVLAGAQIIRSHEVREHYLCLRSTWELMQHRRVRQSTKS
ncbi:dihydropteroate synthase [Candidatus Haliotispira prima]|uniref:dihydropteroate synthase n=1 Tax=Candidatus Haliotispira prima TaxID=3034016 RepID=A0ABY8MJE8_9SPIO|nr:dihydropteroate synthase [Candidatus Haliotispira prima]